jgi:RNA polymerase sporulation-specific sigma factor
MPQTFFGYLSRRDGNTGKDDFFTLEDTMQGKVEICGVNTARLKTLSPVRMDELLHKAKDGDEEARQQLIEGNLRLVLSVIQRFDKRGESPDDLFQVGCIGLMKAISNFDPTKNVRFSTYGVPMV